MAKSKKPWISHIETFVNGSLPPDQQNASLDTIAAMVKNDNLTLEALVSEMELYLTTPDQIIRARGILLLGEILSRLQSKPFNSAIISSLAEFFTSKLADWHALRGTLVGCLALLKRKGNVGMVTASEAKRLSEAYFADVTAQSLPLQDRKLCFEVLQCLMDVYPEVMMSLDEQLFNGILDSIDGEKDPRCLMLAFHLAETLMTLFAWNTVSEESFVPELFEILSNYFPIYFTHQSSDEFSIKRDDLSTALMNAFCSTPLFEPFSIPLLLEKLSSSLPLAKSDSLKYLCSCISKYGGDRMIKHAEAIWYALKDVIFNFSHRTNTTNANGNKDPVEDQIAEEAFACLHVAISHLKTRNSEQFLKLILDDHDIKRNFELVCLEKSYSGISVESQKRLSSFGSVVSIASKVSNDCCNEVFHTKFPHLMKLLGVSMNKSPNSVLHIMNFGALYLCVELLASCRNLTMVNDDVCLQVYDEWWCLLKDYSESLAFSLGLTLTNTIDTGNAGAEHVACLVKGLQLLATFPENFSPISEETFEYIMEVVVSVIISKAKVIILWRSALESLVQIGLDIEKFHDTTRKMSYKNIVVDRIVSSLSHDDCTLPLALKLEAISEIGATSQDFISLVIQGLEKALFTNFFDACVNGSLGAANILILLLDCYSNKVLQCSHKFGIADQVAMQFAINLWTSMEKSGGFSVNLHRQDLLDKTMMTMKLVVGHCSEENQWTLVQKAHNTLFSTTSKLSDTLLMLSLETTHSSSHISELSSTDEWLVSLFSALIIALHPQTPLPNADSLINFFTVFMLNGHLPSAQSLASILNKWPSSVDKTDTCKLNEAIDAIIKELLGVFSSHVDDGFSSSNSSFHQQAQAIVGLAWIGKGLLLRGHEKVKEIVMFILQCLSANQNIKISSPLKQYVDDNHQAIKFYAPRAAADAFHILLSDSNDCLNRKFHATIKPLYKQRFFSCTVPVLLSSIRESDSSDTRNYLYRSLGHIFSNTPLAILISEAKKVVPPLLESLTIASLDVVDKNMTYNLLLVLSGILMDENRKEAIIENAHIIIGHLIKLVTYPHMMLVRETTIQCLTAMSALPHTKIYPLRPEVLNALSSSLDDRKRVVRQEAIRCRQAWASIASRSLQF